MARKTNLKIPNKAIEFSTKIKGYLPFPMNFNVTCVLFPLLSLQLIKNVHSSLRKDTFMIRNGWNILKIGQPTAWFLHGHSFKIDMKANSAFSILFWIRFQWRTCVMIHTAWFLPRITNKSLWFYLCFKISR